MFSIFKNKSFDQIEYTDLQDIISNQLPESVHLDYKEDLPKKGNKIRANEIGKDISSFANTLGGWILYGVKEYVTESEILPSVELPPKGIQKSAGLEDRIEDLILSSISPKPFYRIKRIDIVNSDRCLILVYIPQAYNNLHMVSIKNEWRFYKRHEYKCIPMDHFEIRNRFEQISIDEKSRKSNYLHYVNQISQHIPLVHTSNIIHIGVIPKFLIEHHFNNKERLEKILEINRQNNPLVRLFSSPIRRSDRFYTDLVFQTGNRMVSINFYYNGTIILVMPLDLFSNSIVDASSLYAYLYHFYNLILSYYNEFSFQGIVDLSLALRGIKGRTLDFKYKSTRSFWNKSFTFDEEIQDQWITMDLNDLENEKIEVIKSLIRPLYYARNLDVIIDLCDEDGYPIYEID